MNIVWDLDVWGRPAVHMVGEGEVLLLDRGALPYRWRGERVLRPRRIGPLMMLDDEVVGADLTGLDARALDALVRDHAGALRTLIASDGLEGGVAEALVALAADEVAVSLGVDKPPELAPLLALGGRLTALKLGPLTGAQIKTLSKLPALSTLRADKIADSAASKLAQLHALRALSVRGERLTDAGVTHIGALTALRSLEILGGRHTITDACAAHLAQLGALRSLHISTIGPTGALCHSLSALPLRRLKLTSLRSAGELWGWAAQQPELIELDLSFAQGLAQAPPTLDMGASKLQIVRAAQSASQDATVAALATLPALEALDVQANSLTPHAVHHLAAMRALRWLHAGQSGLRDLSPLGALTSLHTLGLNHTSTLAPDALAHLPQSVERLSVDAMRLPTASLLALGHRPALRWLSAHGTQLDDAGLAQLVAQLPALEGLEVGGCEALKGPGLGALVALEALRALNLREMSGDDQSLALLHALHRLERLYVSGHRLSIGARQALRAALPGCQHMV